MTDTTPRVAAPLQQLVADPSCQYCGGAGIIVTGDGFLHCRCAHWLPLSPTTEPPAP